jgi:hypothetical protein
MREMRVKGDYIHHESIKGSMGIKISASGLDNARLAQNYTKEKVKKPLKSTKLKLPMILLISWINMLIRLNMVFLFRPLQSVP